MAKWQIIILTIMLIFFKSSIAYSSVECDISTDNTSWVNVKSARYGGCIEENSKLGYIHNLDEANTYYLRCKNSTTLYNYIEIKTDGVDEMELSLIVGIGIVAGILLFIAFSMDKDDHKLLKLLHIFFAMFLLILIPSTLVNGAAATSDNFLRSVIWILIIFCGYIFVYFIYALWLKSKLVDLKFIKEKPKKQ